MQKHQFMHKQVYSSATFARGLSTLSLFGSGLLFGRCRGLVAPPAAAAQGQGSVPENRTQHLMRKKVAELCGETRIDDLGLGTSAAAFGG